MYLLIIVIIGVNFKFIENKNILLKITSDLNKPVPLYEQTDLYLNNITSTKELCDYISNFPGPKTKETKSGNSLKDTPVFYIEDKIFIQDNDAMSYSANGTTCEFINNYKQCETYHKTVEKHHPDGSGWEKGVLRSFECTIDIFNSLLRTSSLEKAWEKLLKILSTKKFINLDTNGIYYALLHCLSRGVANTDHIHETAIWRKRDHDRIIKDHNNFLLGHAPSDLIIAYRKESMVHQMYINIEMYRFESSKRINNRKSHDYTKFSDKMIFYYTWYWGVFNQMPKKIQKQLGKCVVKQRKKL